MDGGTLPVNIDGRLSFLGLHSLPFSRDFTNKSSLCTISLLLWLAVVGPPKGTPPWLELWEPHKHIFEFCTEPGAVPRWLHTP